MKDGGIGSGVATGRGPVESRLLQICGWIGLLGFAVTIGGNIAGSLLAPDYSFFADTISDLAAGRYEILQDGALYAFSVAVFAVALGGAHMHPGSFRWSLGLLSLMVMGGLVAVIGARDEYGDRDAVEGVHLWLVGAMTLFMVAAPLLMAPHLGRAARWVRVGVAVFVVAAVIYWFLPTSFDGLWERALALLAGGFIVLLALRLLRAA